MDKPAIELPAYARKIGVELENVEGELPVLAIDYQDDICGNPGMFHGGVVGSLLEMAAVTTLNVHLGNNGTAKLVVLNATVDFLRTALERRTFATATIVRAGRRLALIQATCWQDSPDKLVATAMVNILITPADG